MEGGDKATAQVVRRVLQCKAKLDAALDATDVPPLESALEELGALAITVEVMRATRIAASVNTLRKQSHPQLSGRAKALVKAWKGILKLEAARLQQPEPPVEQGPGSAPHAADEAELVRLRERTRGFGKPCPPNPTQEAQPFSAGRRWDGVDGRLGPDDKWYSWDEPVPFLQHADDVTIVKPYVVLDRGRPS